RAFFLIFDRKLSVHLSQFRQVQFLSLSTPPNETCLRGLFRRHLPATLCTRSHLFSYGMLNMTFVPFSSSLSTSMPYRSPKINWSRSWIFFNPIPVPFDFTFPAKMSCTVASF